MIREIRAETNRYKINVTKSLHVSWGLLHFAALDIVRLLHLFQKMDLCNSNRAKSMLPGPKITDKAEIKTIAMQYKCIYKT